MKKILSVVFLALPFLLVAQSDASPNGLFNSLIITPQKGKMKELRDNLAAHNKKYHSEGPHVASVYGIGAGPNHGKWMWVMGPCKFEHLDEHPAGEEHGQDWRDNVIPLTEDIAHNGFWHVVSDLSYAPEGAVFEKFRARYVNVKQGERYRFNKLMANIRDVYVQKEYKSAHVIYDRRLASTDGRDVGVMFGYESWSALDGGGIAGDYEEVHGDGSWTLFLEELEECVEGTEDELWRLIEGMSGAGQ